MKLAPQRLETTPASAEWVWHALLTRFLTVGCQVVATFDGLPVSVLHQIALDVMLSQREPIVEVTIGDIAVWHDVENVVDRL